MKYSLNLAIVLVYVTVGVEIISFFIEKNKHDQLFGSFWRELEVSGSTVGVENANIRSTLSASIQGGQNNATYCI